MKNDIDINLNQVRQDIFYFKKDPTSDADNANLRNAFDRLNDLELSKSALAYFEFKKYRVEILSLHIEIVELFERYYIANYKPKQPYYMTIMPPQGAIDEPIFGSVNPDTIKDKNIREKYIKDIEENKKTGREIAFQGELARLKYELSAPNIESGEVASLELFIKRNYTFNLTNFIEVKDIINKSKLENKTKEKIIHDISKW